ncbi:MAG TPA: hypothetical protein DCE71_08090 [Parachlamydiales bacterium]|nr:hypothetical protein [Parachlamydiales bacterium]
MKASVYLAMGDLKTSEEFMTKCIQNLDLEMTSNPSLEYMIELYYKALRSCPSDQIMPRSLAMRCKHPNHEQPIGVEV